MSKIYLDVCCLCRQFDDQTNVRIALESYAITHILQTIDNLENELVLSEVIYFELNKIPDIFKKHQIIDTIKQFEHVYLINEYVIVRAKQFENMGFGGLDSIHISMAEFAKADYFLTTDDKLQKIYNKNKNKISIKILNPIDFLRNSNAKN